MRDAVEGLHSEREGRAEERLILLVLPYDMSVRNFVASHVVDHVLRSADFNIALVSRHARDAAPLAGHGERLKWRPILRPFHLFPYAKWPLRRRISWAWGDARAAIAYYWYLTLVFRFNAIQGFKGFEDRLRQSRPMRRLAFKEGLPSVGWLGFPFARSRRFLQVLLSLYFRTWQRHPAVKELFDEVRPVAVVLTHLQTSPVVPYLIEAHARGIPVLGVNGSWDQPTTKGPMLPGLERILVQSDQVAADLFRFHGVRAPNVRVIGWPQMDVYADRSKLKDRAAFLKQLGLPPGSRYVLLGAYAERLGAHEPMIAARLASDFAEGALKEQDIHLYIRCHPLDLGWQQRFGDLGKNAHVRVEPPSLGDLDHLANLIAHASVVLCSAGTMNLDAVALDTPSIALAFEEADLPYFDRTARRYDMEHIAAVMATGGIRKVATPAELTDAVRNYLSEPDTDAVGRSQIRKHFLGNLDGCASRRTADEMIAFVRTCSA